MIEHAARLVRENVCGQDFKAGHRLVLGAVGIEVLVLGKARREPELRRKKGKSCDHGGSSYVNTPP